MEFYGTFQTSEAVTLAAEFCVICRTFEEAEEGQLHAADLETENQSLRV